jgi:hypothetical protein
MNTATLSGVCPKSDGTPETEGVVIIDLIGSFVDGETLYSNTSDTYTINGNGEFEAILNTPPIGLVNYSITIPNGSRFEFSVASGDKIDFNQLKSISVSSLEEAVSIKLMSQHAISFYHQSHNVLAYGARCNGVTDDVVAIQSAINAAAINGGDVILPPRTILLGAPIIPKNGVTIRGTYPTAVAQQEPWDGNFIVNGGTVITYPGGTVFGYDESKGPGTDSSLAGICIENMGFDNIGSIMANGATNKSGMVGSVVRNLLGSRINGLAIDLTNPLQNHISNIRVCAKQILRVTSDYDSTQVVMQPGNQYIDDVYGYIFEEGHSLPSVHLRALNTGGHGQFLNYISIFRLQVNRHQSNAKTGNHIRIEGAGGYAVVSGTLLDALDLEGAADHRVHISNAQKQKMTIMGTGSNGADSNADVYIRDSHDTHITCLDEGLTLDMDNTAQPIFWEGVMYNVVGAGMFPIGIWYSLVDVMVHQSLNSYGAFGTLKANIFNSYDMPVANYFNFTNGGGVRERYFSTPGDLSAIESYMGLIELTGTGDQAVALEDATKCPGATVTFKKTGATGTVTLTAHGTQTIDGSNTNTYLSAINRMLQLQSNGSNWLIIAKI